MASVFRWYLFSLVLLVVNFPLCYRLFHRLRTRGLGLARPLALLLWGYAFWLLNSVGLLQNNLAAEITVLSLLAVLNLWIAYKTGFGVIGDWLRENWRTLLALEAVFLFAFLFWALVRACNPDIINTEKFMEMGFINAILKSPTLPPHDPWLSSYGISYYYFGYVLSAMLVRITGVLPSVGYNLVSAACFALTGAGAYAILLDLLSHKKTNTVEENSARISRRTYLLALLAPLMLLIVANLFGVLDVMHARGLFSDGAFWKNLAIPELETPASTQNWWPMRGGWSWWQASRVVQDFKLDGTRLQVIDEFPFFTFLLSDIHPHMLNMPFVLLLIGQALNALWGAWEGAKKQLSAWVGYALIALISLGGMAFMNTWDFPFYLVLLVVCLVWRRASLQGWRWGRLAEFIVLCLAGGVLSVLLYLPFYLSFASQAGGILPSLSFFTQGRYFWIMFAPLIVPIYAFLAFKLLRKERVKALLPAFLTTLGLFVLLFVFSWGLAFLGAKIKGLEGMMLGNYGGGSVAELLSGSLLARLKAPGSWISLFLLIFGILALLWPLKAESATDLTNEQSGEYDAQNAQIGVFSPRVFALFLALLGALLTLAPEFVFLRDLFGTRLNTIFKFYYQAWICWSLAGSFAIAYFLQEPSRRPLINRIFVAMIFVAVVMASVLTRPSQNGQSLGSLGSNVQDYVVLAIPLLFLLWALVNVLQKQGKQSLAILCLLVLSAGLVYPALELGNKTSGFKPVDGLSLDGRQSLMKTYPAEMAGAAFLQEAPLGVMVEAVADNGGQYSTYNLVSVFSGQPTVLGWVGHEGQWRGGYAEIGSRQADIKDLYSNPDWARSSEIIDRYNIRYIVVGSFERQTYRLAEDKFIKNLSLVYQTPGLSIYETTRK